MSDQAREAARALRLLAEQGALATMCRARGVELFVLFGSAADDDQDPGDVDIAVAFDRAAPADVLGLLEELHRATGYEGFDVLDLRRAGPVAREQALVDCRLLHQAEPGLFANAQIAAIMERIETDEFRRIQLELMAG